MRRNHHLFLNQIFDNNIISGMKSAHDLPFSDMSLFSSGFLIDQNFTPEQRDDILKYVSFRKSEHFAGETLLNVSGILTDDDGNDIPLNQQAPNGSFTLNDRGSLLATIAGPGFNNVASRTKFTETTAALVMA